MADTKDKKLCFVITPIGDNNSDIRRHIDGIIDQAIVPALGEKYDVVVAHRKYEIGSINDRVVRSVFEADLVIANLTNTNPNVMYELAIRYSFGKPAIVIAEEGTNLPFDVIDENTIFYRNDPTGANDLKQKLIEYEKPIAVEKKEYGPVYKVIKTVPIYDEVESGKDVSQDKVLQYIIDRLDSLEKNIINIKLYNRIEKKALDSYDHYLEVQIRNEEGFTGDEINEIRDILDGDSITNKFKFLEGTKSIEIQCILNNKDYEILTSLLDTWTSSKRYFSCHFKRDDILVYPSR